MRLESPYSSQQELIIRVRRVKRPKNNCLTETRLFSMQDGRVRRRISFQYLYGTVSGSIF